MPDQTEQATRTCILVLGMHRSGTSALTRVLALLGAALPQEILPANQTNEAGHWEPERLVALNDRLLAELGSSWHDWRPIDMSDLPEARRAEIAAEIRTTIEADYADKPLFVVKDPRICRFADFFIRAVEDAGIRVVPVIPFRNPLDVSASLQIRTGAWSPDLSDADAALMWLTHVLGAYFDTAGRDRPIVSYEELMNDWRKTIATIVERTGIDFPVPVDEAAETIDAFLSQRLRHHAHNRDEIAADALLNGWVTDAHDALTTLAANPSSNTAPVVLERVRSELRRSLPVFNRLMAKGEENLERRDAALKSVERDLGHFKKRERDLYKLIAKERAEHATLLTDARDNAAILSDARQSLLEAVGPGEGVIDQIRAMRQTLDGHRTEIVELRSVRDATQRRAIEMSATLEARLSEIASLSEALEQRQQDLVRLEEQRQLDLEQLQRERAEDQARFDEARRLDHETLAQERQLRADLLAQTRRLREELTGQVQRLQDDANGLKSKLDTAQSAAARLQAELAHTHEEYRSSTSWKLSAPLRAVKTGTKGATSLVSAFPAIVTFGGGVFPTTKKVIGLLRREGLKGIRTRFTAAERNREELRAWYQRKGQSGASSAVVLQSDAGVTAEKPAYVPLLEAAPLASKPAKVIAFYLPQFHPIPENDEWWGEGFTEWTNVRSAEPTFEGHEQPKVPGELGYYDLRDTEVQRRQIELAQLYGIEGFCFYFYWFGGKRLLEKPLENWLADTSLDLPFCLCWANENWTRRWDGLDREILIAQDHSDEDDLAFIREVAPYLKDPRYIRIDGKPLLLVYRPSELPSVKDTARRWREWCRENGVGEIFLAYTQSFERQHPAEYGFDAAIEFPPNNSSPPDVTKDVTPLDGDFKTVVYDWNIFPMRSERYVDRDYPLFRSVCPGWDNTARRKHGGTAFVNNTPDAYRHWLENAINDTVGHSNDPSDRLVFVNAWNEWAEGAYLEPDARHGYAYLQATREALENASKPDRRGRVIVVSHDAHPHGAQMLALNLCRVFSQTFDLSVDLVLLGDGPLAPRFSEYATVHSLAGRDPAGDAARSLCRSLREKGAGLAICNTTVSGPFAETLARDGLRIVSLIHELPDLIRNFGIEDAARKSAESSNHVVFPAEVVVEGFSQFAELDSERTIIRPQGSYKRNRFRNLPGDAAAREALRSELDLPSNKKLVLGVGYADHRKGFDIFIALAERLAARSDSTCVWLGHHDTTLISEHAEKIGALEERGALLLPGIIEDTDAYYAAANVFVLTSREDPYPSTVLEALDVGLPVVGFEGVTGTSDLIAKSDGYLVAPFDLDALTATVETALQGETPERRRQRARDFWLRPETSFQAYAADLLALGGMAPKSISVVLPNFNYAQFLPERINSILNQSFPLHELIILDDASTDASSEVIEAQLARIDIPVRIVRNVTNSGSVFRQWLKGAELATGDFVWIAEADDIAEPGFLQEVMQGFGRDDEDVVLSYCQSKQMAPDGKILCDDYLDYVSDVSPTQWLSAYRRGGVEEIVHGLSVKNTIPNVSAVVFRRRDLVETMRAHLGDIMRYRVAGDWCTYVRLLQRGSCAYSPKPLNLHRRHSESVTLSRFGNDDLREIERMQQLVLDLYVDACFYREPALSYLDQLRAQFGLKETSREAANP
ncbi:glycoside hydrolase family 99-like domain-containing protein [Oricola sp.]|uniref:glycoside hydrolase family 99-like domain-containing protein n=1 Tax=Oricola sp. TaxID=1979950 RepID=UPI0025E4DECB|nr:glycoside hydrolase family 99-like domain-containing protein [Oricola sp.]MCI5073594.1 glycoside hydrolase family 99-like domain-containing protein [Oricola sp.]